MLNRAAIIAAVATAKPDVIVHEMTSLGVANDLRSFPSPIVWSFLHIDDAAAATAIAVARGSAGIYNIVDGEPAPVHDWLPALARMLGARPPWHIPKWLARITAGEHIVRMMTEARAGSNAKAKRDLAWQPTHASWRNGFAEVLAQRA